jgi:hypothetical protein
VQQLEDSLAKLNNGVLAWLQGLKRQCDEGRDVAAVCESVVGLSHHIPYAGGSYGGSGGREGGPALAYSAPSTPLPGADAGILTPLATPMSAASTAATEPFTGLAGGVGTGGGGSGSGGSGSIVHPHTAVFGQRGAALHALALCHSAMRRAVVARVETLVLERALAPLAELTRLLPGLRKAVEARRQLGLDYDLAVRRLDASRNAVVAGAPPAVVEEARRMHQRVSEAAAAVSAGAEAVCGMFLNLEQRRTEVAMETSAVVYACQLHCAAHLSDAVAALSPQFPQQVPALRVELATGTRVSAVLALPRPVAQPRGFQLPGSAAASPTVERIDPRGNGSAAAAPAVPPRASAASKSHGGSSFAAFHAGMLKSAAAPAPTASVSSTSAAVAAPGAKSGARFPAIRAPPTPPRRSASMGSSEDAAALERARRGLQEGSTPLQTGAGEGSSGGSSANGAVAVRVSNRTSMSLVNSPFVGPIGSVRTPTQTPVPTAQQASHSPASVATSVSPGDRARTPTMSSLQLNPSPPPPVPPSWTVPKPPGAAPPGPIPRAVGSEPGAPRTMSEPARLEAAMSAFDL